MAMYVDVNQMHHLEMWTKVECLEYTQIDDRILYKSLSTYIADCQFPLLFSYTLLLFKDYAVFNLTNIL